MKRTDRNADLVADGSSGPTAKQTKFVQTSSPHRKVLKTRTNDVNTQKKKSRNTEISFSRIINVDGCCIVGNVVLFTFI